MYDLTPDGLRILDDVAQRHGVGLDVVVTLVRALAEGHGTQAQFNHPEIGGMGQWSQGGMVMVGDMFNNALKYRVDALCTELAPLVRGRPLFAAPAATHQSQSQGAADGVSLFVAGSASGSWWPPELGAPSSTGAQNDLRYAWFPTARRLAIQQGGRCDVYDTGDHAISGFSQQQSGDRTLTFTSQYGLVRIADLARIPPADAPAAVVTPPPAAPAPETRAVVAPAPAAPVVVTPPAPFPTVAAPEVTAIAPAALVAPDEILTTIERLASLRDKGILTDAEFAAKKAELLSRL